MFTGFIKAKGTIAAMEQRGGDVRLTVSSDGLPWQDYEVGESIAVNGVCLTAVALHEHGFDTDVSVETLDVTALRYVDVVITAGATAGDTFDITSVDIFLA